MAAPILPSLQGNPLQSLELQQISQLQPIEQVQAPAGNPAAVMSTNAQTQNEPMKYSADDPRFSSYENFLAAFGQGAPPEANQLYNQLAYQRAASAEAAFGSKVAPNTSPEDPGYRLYFNQMVQARNEILPLTNEGVLVKSNSPQQTRALLGGDRTLGQSNGTGGYSQSKSQEQQPSNAPSDLLSGPGVSFKPASIINETERAIAYKAIGESPTLSTLSQPYREPVLVNTGGFPHFETPLPTGDYNYKTSANPVTIENVTRSQKQNILANKQFFANGGVDNSIKEVTLNSYSFPFSGPQNNSIKSVIQSTSNEISGTGGFASPLARDIYTKGPSGLESAIESTYGIKFAGVSPIKTTDLGNGVLRVTLDQTAAKGGVESLSSVIEEVKSQFPLTSVQEESPGVFVLRPIVPTSQTSQKTVPVSNPINETLKEITGNKIGPNPTQKNPSDNLISYSATGTPATIDKDRISGPGVSYNPSAITNLNDQSLAKLETQGQIFYQGDVPYYSTLPTGEIKVITGFTDTLSGKTYKPGDIIGEGIEETQFTPSGPILVKDGTKESGIEAINQAIKNTKEQQENLKSYNLAGSADDIILTLPSPDILSELPRNQFDNIDIATYTSPTLGNVLTGNGQAQIIFGVNKAYGTQLAYALDVKNREAIANLNKEGEKFKEKGKEFYKNNPDISNLIGGADNANAVLETETDITTSLGGNALGAGNLLAKAFYIELPLASQYASYGIKVKIDKLQGKPVSTQESALAERALNYEFPAAAFEYLLPATVIEATTIVGTAIGATAVSGAEVLQGIPVIGPAITSMGSGITASAPAQLVAPLISGETGELLFKVGIVGLSVVQGSQKEVPYTNTTTEIINGKEVTTTTSGSTTQLSLGGAFGGGLAAGGLLYLGEEIPKISGAILETFGPRVDVNVPSAGRVNIFKTSEFKDAQEAEALLAAKGTGTVSIDYEATKSISAQAKNDARMARGLAKYADAQASKLQSELEANSNIKNTVQNLNAMKERNLLNAQQLENIGATNKATEYRISADAVQAQIDKISSQSLKPFDILAKQNEINDLNNQAANYIKTAEKNEAFYNKLVKPVPSKVDAVKLRFDKYLKETIKTGNIPEPKIVQLVEESDSFRIGGDKLSGGSTYVYPKTTIKLFGEDIGSFPTGLPEQIGPETPSLKGTAVPGISDGEKTPAKAGIVLRTRLGSALTNTDTIQLNPLVTTQTEILSALPINNQLTIPSITNKKIINLDNVQTSVMRPIQVSTKNIIASQKTLNNIVQSLEEISTQQQIKTQTKEQLQTQEKVQEKVQTQEKVQEKVQTQEKVQEKVQTQVKARVQARIKIQQRVVPRIIVIGNQNSAGKRSKKSRQSLRFNPSKRGTGNVGILPDIISEEGDILYGIKPLAVNPRLNPSIYKFNKDISGFVPTYSQFIKNENQQKNTSQKPKQNTFKLPSIGNLFKKKKGNAF